MPWTESLAIAEIKTGPYLLGKGTAGSETDLGEFIVTGFRAYTPISEIKGGECLGRETTIDVVPTGVIAVVNFAIFQTVGDLNKSVFSVIAPGSTLSTGPTSKTMTLDANTITGVSAVAGSFYGRWVLHHKGTSDKSDTSYDYVLPRAVAYLADDEIPLSGSDGQAVLHPGILIALPDTNNDVVIVGKDAA